jgi:hypothetical protein
VEQFFVHALPWFLSTLRKKIVGEATAREASAELELSWQSKMLTFLASFFDQAGGWSAGTSFSDEVVAIPQPYLASLVTMIVKADVPSALVVLLPHPVFGAIAEVICFKMTMNDVVGAHDCTRRALALAFVPAFITAQLAPLDKDVQRLKCREMVLSNTTGAFRGEGDGGPFKCAGIDKGRTELEVIYNEVANEYWLSEGLAKKMAPAKLKMLLDQSSGEDPIAKLSWRGLARPLVVPSSPPKNSGTPTPKRVAEEVPIRYSKCQMATSSAKRCSKCKKVFYCSIDCQRKDWAGHRPTCG